jgi:hypothetical protein
LHQQQCEAWKLELQSKATHCVGHFHTQKVA